MSFDLATMAILGGASSSSRALSATAGFINEAFHHNYAHLLRSYTFGAATRGLLESLERLEEDCSEAGWDGYNAAPVSVDTFEIARNLITVLPYNIHSPEISAEPDGHIVFEWYRSPAKVLSVSITAESEIHFAALIGSAKVYGTELFKGAFPQSILDIIQRIFAQ